MSSKAKAETKVPVLKGQEAEDKVLEYMKRMNRPYGAVDVAANLKGAVPKAATQKILVALAEKGLLVQKTYGKTTFFVINQANIDVVPKDALADLETEQKAVDEENKQSTADLRTANLELAKLKTAPSDHELDLQIKEISKLVTSLSARLQPLRLGAPLISADELALIDTEWTKWRGEWTRRKKVFTTFWQLATDSLPPQDAADLAEDLVIESTQEKALARQLYFQIVVNSANLQTPPSHRDYFVTITTNWERDPGYSKSDFLSSVSVYLGVCL
ncbi:putative homologous recombination [Lyophyllum shimeji]|uniref:Homologous recombination n=1 Tax=Lyophyllum shimeji TaxID=47721 RepID=A0A9P3PKZ8_LYOSH|nr:putative homologous recombination [Lyophyllum shimeji]